MNKVGDHPVQFSPSSPQSPLSVTQVLSSNSMFPTRVIFKNQYKALNTNAFYSLLQR